MSTTPYEVDFYRWAAETARALREGRIADLDLAHIAEEIEDMGKGERRELVSRLAVLLAHLVKWVRQPEQHGNSWRATIEEQRAEVLDLIADGPSLRPVLEERLADAYAKAVRIAVRDTGFDPTAFPPECPFTVNDALNRDLWPS
jgi:hypothetical protein